MTVQEIISTIPKDFEITIGKHREGHGYYAQILSLPSENCSIYWEDASHGITLEEAVYNAHCRFTDQEETLYKEEDFQ